MSRDKLISRQEVFENMLYTRFDCRNGRQSFKTAMAIIAVLYIAPISWLYLTYAPLAPYQRALLIGFCFPLVWFGALWSRFSKLWQASITLTIEGLRIEKDGNSELMSWDSMREIKAIRRGFSVRSDLAEIKVWNEIGPADVPWTSFRYLFGLGESRSKTLIDQIKAMNPSIVHIEPFLSRDLQFPVFERVIATLMILAVILFVIVIIFTRPESAGR